MTYFFIPEKIADSLNWGLAAGVYDAKQVEANAGKSSTRWSFQADIVIKDGKMLKTRHGVLINEEFADSDIDALIDASEDYIILYREEKSVKDVQEARLAEIAEDVQVEIDREILHTLSKAYHKTQKKAKR